MAGPPEQPSRRSDPQRKRRVTKRLYTETIERLVAEHTAGATAALQSGGAGIVERHCAQLAANWHIQNRHFARLLLEFACCRVPAGAESRIRGLLALWPLLVGDDVSPQAGHRYAPREGGLVTSGCD
jgi:hypothetical protein